MKKIYLTLLIFCFFEPVCFSISDEDSSKKSQNFWTENHYVDMSMALGTDFLVSSIQCDKLFALGLERLTHKGFLGGRIKIGMGARMNVANYWNKDFYTAPPQQVAGAGVDTLSMAHQSVYFFNLQFLAEIALLKWWDVGMNIDLIGFSWGPKANGSYYSYATGDKGSVQQVSPETLNLMLFGKNDFGNLNSQFYFRFWAGTNVFFKAGMSLGTFTLESDIPLNNGNSRFHAGSYMGFLSLGWTPGRNPWKRRIFSALGNPSF